MLCHCFYALIIQCIGGTLFAIRSFKFEVVSDTHDLNTIRSKPFLQPTPIVSSFNTNIYSQCLSK